MKTNRVSRTKQIVAATVRQKNRAITRGLKVGHETQNQLVPKDTGFLESRNLVEDDGNGHGKLENDCEYAGHQEYGTFKMAAQPFFRPAVDAGRQELKRNMKVVAK